MVLWVCGSEGGKWNKGDERRGEETQVSGVSKLNSLRRSDLGKLDCHYRIVMIYTYPSRGEGERRAEYVQ